MWTDEIHGYGVFAMGTTCDLQPVSPYPLTTPAWGLGEEATAFSMIGEMKATKFGVLERGGCLLSFRTVHGAGHVIDTPSWPY